MIVLSSLTTVDTISLEADWVDIYPVPSLSHPNGHPSSKITIDEGRLDPSLLTE